MLYLDINNPAPLLIPRNGYELTKDRSLAVRNTTDGTLLDLVLDAVQVVGDFFSVSLAAIPASLHAGEWEYCFALQNGSTAIVGTSTGIIAVTGEPTKDVKQYNEETNYKQYGD